jgi:serine/threonine-protein phosphatase 4 regulatory subunit 1
MILQKDQKKWRIRECIAGQLTSLSEIYSLQTVFSYLIPITFKFCSDPVSIVRTEAALQIGSLVKKFNTEETKDIYLPAIIENIKGFANFSKFTQR